MQEDETTTPVADGGDRIRKIDIGSEMKSAYIDYSMSVIVSRALPDVRDGLKPVHRRVLYGMNEMGNTSNHPYKKSANCVGEVMGKYHPHGDSSIYGTVARLAQDWNMRYTLVDGNGNFGSIDGDSPAAMRYTEVRLRRIGEEMLANIDEDTVDFQPNYDASRKEPTVLPTRFPNLLVNGASGIAVGMATNMAPHNMTEAIDASIALIDNPDMTIPELMEIIPAPDFPTGGIIYGYAGVRDAFETGRGRIIIRAKTEIEVEDSHENIVVTEIPYAVNRRELIDQIKNLVNEKKIDGIANVNDESDYEGMRIVIHLKSDTNSQVTLNKLFKLSQLQASFSVNNVALVDGRPRTLNLKDILTAFIQHRHEVVVRRTQFRLGKARERAHILEGLILASQNIDEVVRIIRSSSSTEDARNRLSERFGLSEAQTTAIVEMRLRQLTGLEQDKLNGEYKEVMDRIAEYELILSDDNVCRELIKNELIEVREKYGDKRKTRIVKQATEFRAEDEYADDDMVITISHMGYIKRTPLKDFRAQNRGGIGSRGSVTRSEDFIEHIYMASMHSSMLFFTQRGRCYWMKVYELPEGTRQTKGRAIQNLLNIEPGDSVKAFISVKGLEDKEFVTTHNLVFSTRNGVIKKTSLEAYSRPRAKGVNAIVIREDDSLINVELTDGNSEIILASRQGRAIRFHENKVREMGRVSTGVRGMRLEGDDYVVGMVCMSEESANTLMVITENGYGKRSALAGYRVTNRGGKGVCTLKVTEKTGLVVGIASVNDSNDLMIINKSGITLRVNVSAFRVMGRYAQGLRLINLEKRNDSIASFCSVDSDPEEEVDNSAIDAEAQHAADIIDEALETEEEIEEEIEEDVEADVEETDDITDEDNEDTQMTLDL
ncbi:MAG: DNA gyrase subunit A [Clostridium sp.]|nr:DNA gyrase subunit A [Clostridium sp.]